MASISPSIRSIWDWATRSLLLDRAEDATMFVREIGQRAEAGHPGRLPVAGLVPARRAASELFLKRLGEETPQCDATGGGKRLGLPEHGVGEVDGRFHRAIFP